MANIGKFYACLQSNQNTPFPLKMKILYGCFFPSLLYSCETWGDITDIADELLLMERKALRSCLGVKQSTPDEILYVEINKPDIIHYIKSQQQKFYKKFLEVDAAQSSAKRIWQKYVFHPSIMNKPLLAYYDALFSNELPDDVESKKRIIIHSAKSMHTHYRGLFDLKYSNVLYNSMVEDCHRVVITRWRLSCHKLFVETGRYKGLDRHNRICIICLVVEDESHALFACRAHIKLREKHQQLLHEYNCVEKLLDPRTESDVIRVSIYIQDIERNMVRLKMMR